jgi:hypothetical protein
LHEKNDPSVYGAWEPIKYKFHHLPVHMALLHTGNVLAFGGSGNDPKHLSNFYEAELFEPDSIEHEVIDDDNHHHESRVSTISNEGIEGDTFCAGHVFLPDGRLFITGGTYRYDGSFLGIAFPPFTGLEHTYVFDPTSLKWERKGNMKHGRWYPTCVMLSDGQVLVMAGLQRQFPWVFLKKLEIHSNDAGWKELHGADHWLPLYPRLHLLPSGDIFYAGSFNTHYTFPFSVRAFPSASLNTKSRKWKVFGNPNNVNREEGTTVMLPLNPPDYSARVMLIGGGTPGGKDAISDVEMIDFSDPSPHYKRMPSLKHPRYYAYAVLLPDQTILVLGGKSGKKGHLHDVHFNPDMHDDLKEHHHDNEIPHHPDAILEPELFDPKNKTWGPMADMKVDRLYHSNALLLPDGRVMTAGSNPHRTVNELRIEIFRPPYLYRGDRPGITSFKKVINYGEVFEIKSPDADNITSVVLIRASVTTHCVNTEQRLVGLEFSHENPSILAARMPSNRNVAPPGYYLLFILNKDDVPSNAPFIRVGTS